MSFAPVLRNALLLNIATILANLLSFLISVLLGRALGTERFGAYAFALSFAHLFAVILDAGFHTTAIREVAQAKDRGSLAFGLAFSHKLATSLLVFLAFVAILPFFSSLRSELPSLLMAFLFVVLFSLHGLFSSLFAAFQTLRIPALGTVSHKLLFAALCLLGLLMSSKDPLLYLSFLALSQGCILLWTARRASLLPIRLSLATNRLEYKRLLLQALPLGLSSVLTVICTKMDVSMVKLLDSDAAAGNYTAAMQIISFFLFIPANFSTALFPAMAAAGNEEELRLIQRSSKFLFLLGLPLAVGLSALAEPIVLFVWGPLYSHASATLSLLAWSLFVQFFSSLFAVFLSSKAQQGSIFKASILAVLVNATLNLLLISSYGPAGAAGATLLTNCFFFLYFILHARVRSYLLALRWRICVQSILLFTLYYFICSSMRSLHVLIAVLIAFLAYPVLVLLVGIINISDMRQIVRTFASRFSPAR